MFLIEPCCTQKHIPALRQKLGTNGTCFFHGYGDLSLAELLPALITRYTNTELMIVAPALPDKAAKVIQQVMEQEWPTNKGGKVNTVKRLTLITDLRKSKSPTGERWMKNNPFPGRLELKNVQQKDTAIILPDIALTGPINLTYGSHFTALATKKPQVIRALKEEYGRL